MTKPYMFLSYVILGPFNPTIDINVYLQPLIDDLKKLWSGGGSLVLVGVDIY